MLIRSIFAVGEKGGNRMAEYHVGCGAFGIYAGTLEPRNKNLWRNKSEVTNEAAEAVAQWFLLTGRSMTFEYKGERYVLKVEKGDGNG